MAVSRILLLGDLPACEAVDRLFNLQHQRRLEVVVVKGGAEARIADLIAKADGLICRPSADGTLTAAMLRAISRPFVLGTFSKGVDHIHLPPEVKKWVLPIVAAQGDENAAAVAELTVVMACLLLRPVHRAIQQVIQHRFENRAFTDSRRLVGMTWACIGAGAQVRKLIPLLLPWRLSHIHVYHDRMGVEKLDSVLAEVPAGLKLGPVAAHSPVQTTLEVAPGVTTDVVGFNVIEDAIDEADIVSIHVPLVEVDKDRPSTRGLFNKQRIDSMKEGAILLNMSRGAVVDEAAAIAALEAFKLHGFYSDVLDELAERSRDPRHSVLWQRVIRQQQGQPCLTGKELNLLLTPHIGGSTMDAIHAVTMRVTAEVLRRLKFDFGSDRASWEL